MERIKTIIEKAWENRELLAQEHVISAIREVINLLDVGKIDAKASNNIFFIL